jgi:hypothetical protein
VHFTPLDVSEIIINLAIETLTEYAPAVDKDSRSEYQRRADTYTTVLMHPDTPQQFRRAFEAIYLDLFTSRIVARRRAGGRASCRLPEGRREK